MVWDTKSSMLYFRFALSRELHKKLKIKAVEQDKSMAELLIELIEEYLTKDTNQ